MTRHLLIFGISSGIAFTLLFVLTGSPISTSELLVIKPGPTPKGGRSNVKPIEMKWKGQKLPIQLSPSQDIINVRVPLIDPETQLMEGRLLFDRGRIDPKSGRLLVTNPTVIMWELDRERKLVNRARETRLVAEIGLIDTDFKACDLYRKVVLTSNHKDRVAVLQTTELRCHLQEDRISTDKPLSITFGEDFKVLGVGLEATPKTDEMTILSNVLVRLIQRGGTMAMPFVGARKPARKSKSAKPTKKEQTEIITTCDGKLFLKRVDEGRGYQVTFHRNVEVIRGKGRMHSQVLQLALEQIRRPGKPSRDGKPTRQKGIDLKRMTAYDRVQMYHPTQGEMTGDFFRWERLPSQKQRSVLRGSPKLVLTGTNLEVVDKEKGPQDTKKPKKKAGRTIITSTGDMVFLRNAPEQKTQDPELAIFHDNVVLRRLVADLKQGQPLEIRANKLTLFIDVDRTPPTTGTQPKQPKQERKARVQRCVAVGDVRVIDPNFEATGQRCNWHDLGEGDEKLVMIGRPKLILRGVDDDNQVGLPGAQVKAPKKSAKPAKQNSDIEITSRGEMVMRSFKDRAFTLGIFDEDVVVRQFPLSPTGQRLPDHLGADRRSTMLSDHLEIEMFRAETPAGKPRKTGARSRSSMRKMRAVGNVQISSAQGQATAQRLTYDKVLDTIVLTENVLMLSPDGSRYKGDKLTYLRAQDQMTLIATHPRRAEVHQVESPSKDAPKTDKRAEHLIRAPYIFYDRKKLYIRATGGVYSRFLPRPGDEKNSFAMLGPKKASQPRTPGKKVVPEQPTPWVLKGNTVEAWLSQPPEKKGAGAKRRTADKRGSGQLKRLKAQGKVHIYSTSEKDPREAQGDFFDHDRLTNKTLLRGTKKRAEIWSADSQMSGWQINFDHTADIATCPKGGVFRFKEKPEKGAPAKAKKSANQWVTITCDGLVTHDRKAGLATFTRNVKLIREDSEVKADWARATIDPKTRRVRTAVATGKKVTIFSKKEYATGTRLVWNYETKDVELTGSPRTILYQKDNIIQAEIVKFNQDTGEMQAFGKNLPVKILPRGTKNPK